MRGSGVGEFLNLSMSEIGGVLSCLSFRFADLHCEIDYAGGGRRDQGRGSLSLLPSSTPSSLDLSSQANFTKTILSALNTP